MNRENALEINNLTIAFNENENVFNAVDNININVKKGEITGLIGESGCGKTITSLSAIGLLPEDAYIKNGKIILSGKDVTNFSEEQWNELRGKTVSMIFQEPMTSLNPLMTVGKQIEENIKDNSLDKEKRKQAVYNIMEKAGLANVQKLYKEYPHKLSGGMRQRIMICMALINNPDILIADEPTTALDVTIQAQIIELIKKMNEVTNTAVLFISHDLALVKELCKYTYIMYAGKIVENGATKNIIKNPLHPYTKGLLNSIPDISKRGTRLYNIKGFVPAIEERKNIGCPFADRCEKCMDICKTQMPKKNIIDEVAVYCHLYDKAVM